MADIVRDGAPRTVSRTRAEQRRSEALEHAVRLSLGGLLNGAEVVKKAQEFEKFLRNNDGPPRPIEI